MQETYKLIEYLQSEKNLEQAYYIGKELFGLTDTTIQGAVAKVSGFKNYILFTILEVKNGEITSVRKNSTGEVITKGDYVWCTNKYEHLDYKPYRIGPVYFDSALTGWTYGGQSFPLYYEGYLRGSSGLYHLNDIVLNEPKEELPLVAEQENIIEVGGKKYKLVEVK